MASTTKREKDIRLDIADRLVATGGVDRAQISMHPYLETASAYPLYVCIEGHQTALTSRAGMSASTTGAAGTGGALGYDGPPTGPLLYTGTALVTIRYSYDQFPQVRDEAMELVVDYLANAVNGQSLADTTFPADTIVSWKWKDETAKTDRLLLAYVRYTFMLEDWEAFDTTP